MSEHNYQDPKLRSQHQMIRRTFRHSWWGILLSLFISFISIILQLLNPWPLKLLLDSVFGDIAAPLFLEPLTGTFALLIIVAAIYVGLYLLEGLVDIINNYVTVRLTNQLTIKLQTELFNHILRLPFDTKEKLDDSDYIYRVNELTDNLPTLVYTTSVSIISNIIMMFGALVILALLDWQMAIVGGLIVPLLYISIRYFTPRIGKVSEEIAEQTSGIYNESGESIENTTLIQSFNRQGFQTNRLQALLQKRAKMNVRFSLLDSTFSLTNNICTAIGVALVLLIGGNGVFNGTTSVGELIVFITYMSYLYDPIESILSSIGDYKSLVAGVKLVHEVQSEEAEKIDIASAGTPIAPLQGHIVFKDISLQRDGRQVFSGLNLEITPGQKVAFIGPSGSGKSTILNLIPRFIQPSTGFVYIDGQEINDANLANLRNQIGIVSQSPELLSGTIHENIGFAIPDEKLDLPDILVAAQAANAYSFIDKLPDKFETQVSEAGDNFSGGQKQRISIARAFVKNPPILLLDEPTSALDKASATKIVAAINKLMVGKTVLLVTHDTSLLSQMDAVYVVNDGALTKVANMAELDAVIESLASDNSADLFA